MDFAQFVKPAPAPARVYGARPDNFAAGIGPSCAAKF